VLWRCRKGLRERRSISASLTPLRDADGVRGLFWMPCHLVWNGKGCSQLRYLAGKLVSQVLNSVGARPRESPKARGSLEQEGERGESPTNSLGREVSEGDKCLGQH